MFRKQLIDDHVGTLMTSFGGNIPHRPEEPLQKLFWARDVSGLVYRIRDDLGLPNKLRIILVERGGDKDALAWVEFRAPLDCFQKCDLYVHKSFVNIATTDLMVSVLAHELSHLFLDGLRHPLARSEIAVDLTAMIRGYWKFFISRHIQFAAEAPQKYLNREEALYAATLIGYNASGS